MASAEDIADQITRWVQQEKKLISYREIAREFQLNINAAKRVLSQHYTSSPSTYFPTYLLTGTYLPPITTYTDLTSSNGSSKDAMDVDGEEKKNGHAEGNGAGYPLAAEVVKRRGLILVGGEEELEAKKQLFVPGSLAVHVYSLAPARIKDPAQYLTPLLRLRRYKNYTDPPTFGTITGHFEMIRAEGSRSGSGLVAKGKGESSKASGSTSTASASAAAAQPSMFAKQAAKPAAAAASKVKQEMEKGSEDESMKGGIKKGKKKVIDSEDENEEPASSTMPPNKSKQPLAKMKSADADRLAMEAMMDMSDDLQPSSQMSAGDEPAGSAGKNKKKRKSEAGGNAASSADEAAPKPSGGGVRKKRRILKSVTKMDAKGYMVTEDESAYESYSSDGTSEAKKKPTKKKVEREASEERDVKPNVSGSSFKGKPAAAPPKAGGSGFGGGKPAPVKKPGQSSLNSFFKKK